jgi:hypothetical protein
MSSSSGPAPSVIAPERVHYGGVSLIAAVATEIVTKRSSFLSPSSGAFLRLEPKPLRTVRIALRP